MSLCGTDVEPDILSSLPGGIIDQILSHLPIKEAGRTSILSTDWRNKWKTLPNLVFDSQCVSEGFDDLSSIIDNVLLLHSGPIEKFKLSHHGPVDVTDIDRWTLHLASDHLNEFVLEILEGQRYEIPSCLFTCQGLQHLTLFHCWIKPPSTFTGFSELKSLDLEGVAVAQDAFENLIFSCPLLERLTVLKLDFDPFNHLNIHAPNLRYVDLWTKFEDISFENTPQLSVVSICLSYFFESDQSRLHEGSSNLVEFLIHLPRIQRLEIRCYFLKYLARGVVPVKLPVPCTDLSVLSLCIDFYDSKEISAALCLFRSSPNLRELEISVRRGVMSVAHYQEDVYLDFPVMQVQHVRIDGISGIKPELDFISFLLSNSPVLERMTVKPDVNIELELLKELLRFRASGQAEVIYLDP